MERPEHAATLPEGDVNMKFLENHWAAITSGRSRTRIVRFWPAEDAQWA